MITSIANAAAYNPVTNLVTLSRQANERHNDIFSNQTSLVARPTTGAIRHDLSIGLEVMREEQSAPTLGWRRHACAVDLNNPDVFSPVVGMAIAPTGATSEGRTDTVALYAFDGFDAGPRVRLNGGIRVERYSTKSHCGRCPAGQPVTDLDGDGTLVSGKAGIVYRLNDLGNVYASYGFLAHAAGIGQLPVERGSRQPEQPERRSTEVDQLRSRHRSGTSWRTGCS